MNDIIINDITKINKIKYKKYDDNLFYTKIIPYNTNSSIPLHKYWIHINKCKLINITNTKITVGINNTEKSIEIIKELELKLKQLINDEYDYNILLCSKLQDNGNSIPIIDILYDNSTKFFDAHDKEISCIDNTYIENEFTIIIELYVLNVFNKYMVPIWKVVQVKKIEMLNMTKSLFSLLSPLQSLSYQQTTIPQTIQQTIPQTTIPYQKQTHQYQEKPIEQLKNTSITPTVLPIKTVFMPSMADLKGALQKLKPVINTDSKDIQVLPLNLNNMITTNLSQLKHVETKEPIQFVDILKKEHLEEKEKKRKILEEEYNKIMNINKNIKIIIKKQKELYDNFACND